MKRKELNLLTQLGKGEVVRNYYIGSGMYTKKSADYVAMAGEMLSHLGLSEPRHYKSGNDAPKGGWCGDWIKLTSAGTRMKVVRDAVAEFNNIEAKKEAKIKAQRHNEASQALPQLCRERLNNELSMNRRKRLNANIRLYANLLDIDVPDGNDFLKFVQSYAS